MWYDGIVDRILCRGEKIVKTKDVFKIMLVILATAAVVAAIIAAGWVLSKFPWAQTKEFQGSAIIVYLVTLTLHLIFSRPKIQNSEKIWLKKAAKAADVVYWIAAVLYASVLFGK